ncbi:hypothetical protein PROFUN_00813 [Planoprotostelium fungivorum]|uniref:Uncharacterized protein n=1 Tax=Planoprotostelium fungivorum TaxID=1890364 RepID=A0A2P6P046_9EUKA|nr:hypothetical protein PROFUN_00813 [Planoprotostelium fungivorum]
MLPSQARDSDAKAVGDERNRVEKIGVERRMPSPIKSPATPKDHAQTTRKIDRSRGRPPSNSHRSNSKTTADRCSSIPVLVVNLYEKKGPFKMNPTTSSKTYVVSPKREAIKQRIQRERFEEMVERHKRHAAQRPHDLLEAISLTDQKIEPPDPPPPTTPLHAETSIVDSTETDHYTEDQIEREILLLVSKTKTHRHTHTTQSHHVCTRDEENSTESGPAFSNSISSPERDLTWNDRFERKQKEIFEKKKSLQRWQHELETKDKPEAYLRSGPMLVRMEEERRQLREKEEELVAKQVTMHRTARIKR